MRHILPFMLLTASFVGCKTDAARERATPIASQASSESSAKTPRLSDTDDSFDATDAMTQPEELGQVQWGRDFEQAQARAARTGKPLFVLFTEVPGCSTVKGFANDVLTHPLIIEAIETQFVPVAVYNNVGGADRDVLNSFGEPTWNNPVVRLMDAERQLLAPRFSGPYDVEGLLPTMLKALDASSQEVPGYLRDFGQELGANEQGTERAVFSMYCFWSGEAKLGGMDGVVASRTGFALGKEVVEVSYDPAQTSSQVLAQAFGGEPMSQDVSVSSSHKDDKYQLQHSTWRHVPMTAQQASRVNAALGRGESPQVYLSDRQRALHEFVTAHPDAGWRDVSRDHDITSTWRSAMQVQGEL